MVEEEEEEATVLSCQLRWTAVRKLGRGDQNLD